MNAEKLKGYFQVSIENSEKEACDLIDSDTNYIAEKLPQIARHFHIIIKA